jgi:hypothetical protein
MRMSATDLAARCESLYTAAIADILDRRGLTAQTLPPELVPLREGTRLAGPAYPIKGRPALGGDYDASLRKVLDMLASVPAGHVSVYETGDRETAHLGELAPDRGGLGSHALADGVLDPPGKRRLDLSSELGQSFDLRSCPLQSGIDVAGTGAAFCGGLEALLRACECCFVHGRER